MSSFLEDFLEFFGISPERAPHTGAAAGHDA